VSLPVLLALGAAIGGGLVLTATSLRPRTPTLDEAVAAVDTPRVVFGARTRPDRVLVPVAEALGMRRLLTTGVRSDLRVLGRRPEDHLARSVVAALELGLLPPALVGLAALAGAAVPLGLPAIVAVAGAVAGALLPTAGLHRQAERRRQDFRHALGAFFNLVGINIAAGKGVEGALETAAEAGDGESFRQLREALYRAKVAGATPWSGLDRLGQEVGIAELRELAAAVGLAGDVGARVRASLAAKADTLRHRGLAQVEEAATAASERMALPVVALVLCFIAFIGYPAVDRIMTGL
jgi:Flp pilus assembly protein TadB